MFEPFQGAVVQIDMSNLDVFLEQAVYIDHKPMILRGDLHSAGLQVSDRMVGTMMAEF